MPLYTFNIKNQIIFKFMYTAVPVHIGMNI